MRTHRYRNYPKQRQEFQRKTKQNTATETKNACERLISKLDMTEQRSLSGKKCYQEFYKPKKINRKKTEKNTQELCVKYKMCNIFKRQYQKGKKERKEQKNND